MKVQLLRSEGCSHGVETEALVRDVLAAMAPGAAFEVVEITSEAQAATARFAGSPTVLVDGVDLEPDAPLLTGFG